MAESTAEVEQMVPASGLDVPFEMFNVWNEALRAEFLDGRWRGRPLYLDMEDEVLEEVARRAGVTGDPIEGLVSAVRPTLRLKARGPTFSEHNQRLELWKRGGKQGTPPFIALLAFFAVVAEKMRSDQEFNARNYRDRLVEALGASDSERVAAKIKRYLPKADVFWDELNSWLLAGDGAVGLPTAFAFDRRRHVGLPISQVLIRAADREQLHKCFARYGLQPGTMARGEMEHILEEWIPNLASQTLRSHWTHAEAHERITAAACLELETWDGHVGDDEENAPSSSPLRLVARRLAFPKSRLELSVRVQSASHIPLGTYQNARSTGACEAAFESGDGHVELAPSWDDSWLELVHPTGISVPDLLLCDVHLERVAGNGYAIMRGPRRLAVLELDQEIRWSIERPRVRLGERNLLLVRDSLAEEVAGLLEQIASQGWRREHAGELPGCPDGWVLFSDVVVVAIADDDAYSDDTYSLYPVAAEGIALSDGFALPGRSTWHRLHPPTLIASSLADRPARAVLVPIWQEGGDADASGSIVIDDIVGTAILTLADLVSSDGDYRLALVALDARGKPKSELDSAPIHFRSGNRPGLKQIRDRISHYPARSDELGALSASRVVCSETPAVRGAVVIGAASRDHRENVALPRFIVEADETSDDESWLPDPQRSAISEPGTDCLNGAHHWVLDPAPPNSMRAVHGRCVNCGLEQKHGRGQRRRPSSRRPSLRSSTAHYPPQELPEASDGIDADALLDALAYARQGTWASFVSLAEQINDSPWFSLEVARSLSALGHIDLVLDLGSCRPAAWAISPPSLSLLPNGQSAVLCGARSERLVSRIREDAEALGGELQLQRNEDGPSTLTIVGLGPDGLGLLAEEASGAGGDLVEYVESTPLRILASLPPLALVVEALRELPWPSVEARRYDAASRKWAPVDGAMGPGAYQFRTRPTLFGFVPAGKSTMLAGDSRLVKLLASIDARVEPIAYEQESGRLIVPLGARLPGLYERAVTLCSGMLPSRVAPGVVAYEQVPVEVAALLWRALHGGRS